MSLSRVLFGSERRTGGSNAVLDVTGTAGKGCCCFCEAIHLRSSVKRSASESKEGF
jgi:hypothetical protein